MKKGITLTLVLALLLSLFAGITAFAEEPETLTVETRTSSYTFRVGDTFTYSYWMRLVPDIADYSNEYIAELLGEKSSALGFLDDTLENMKLKKVVGSIMFDSDCLSISDAKMPNLKHGVCLEKPESNLGIVDALLNIFKGNLFFADYAVRTDENTLYQNNNVLVTCTFKVTKGSDRPVYLRTKLTELEANAPSPITKQTKDYTFVSKRQPKIPLEAYETINNEQPTIVLKSLVDDAGFDIRYELKTALAEKKWLRPGAGVKVTLMGATTDGRWINLTRETGDDSIAWFYDVPYGQYYAYCSYEDEDGNVYATDNVKEGEVVNVPATAELQGMNLTAADPTEYKPVHVTIDWQGDNGYLPARPEYLYAVLEANGSLTAIDQQRLIERTTETVYFEKVAVNDLTGEPIDYSLRVSAQSLDDIPYSFYVEKVERADGGVDFKITAIYTGDLAALGAIPVDENGHYWVHQDYMDIAPTCTKDGRQYYICEVCHQTRYDSLPAFGHSFSDWTVTIEQQEFECGERERTCMTCGYEETEILPATHEHNYIVDVTAPTCVDEGYTLYTCSGCGYSEQSDFVPALGHSEYVDAAIPATCTESGLTEGLHCGRCGLMLLEQEVVPALGHSWGEWEETLAPTETERGEKQHVCSVCEAVETVPVPELNHEEIGHDYEYSVTVVEPTCTEGGYTIHACFCGEVCKSDWTPETGHTEVIDPGVEPTLKSTGLTEGSHCSVCGEVLVAQERLPKLDSYPVILNLNGIDTHDLYAYVDGKPCERDGNFVYILNKDAKLLTLYSHNRYDEDTHATYPTHMYVWKLSFEDGRYVATRIEQFDDILQYAGSSIRTSGNKGIRMITAVPTSAKQALTWGGLMGYILEEYGTLVAWDSELNGEELTLDTACAKKAYAYKKDTADPIFKEDNGLTQYTNVLVGFTNEKCVSDLSMRSYMILTDVSTGEQIVLYGGTVHRSIGYIAYQNRGVFSAGSAAYDFIWDIIHYVYGNLFDN